MGWKRTKGCEGEQVAIGDGLSWATPCKRGEAERSLEIAKPRAMSLGGSVVANPHQIPHPSTRLNLFNLLGLLGLLGL